MSKPDDPLAAVQQVQTAMATVNKEWAGYPKPTQPRIPDETLDFATGKVKPRE